MDIDQFNRVLEQLTRQQQRVLNKFLSGENDSQLADSLNISQATVRKHIESICKAFGLQNLPGERLSKRSELLSLFYRYKPEWVSRGASQGSTKQTATKDPKDLSPYIHQFSVYDSGWTGRNDLVTELSHRLQENCRLLLLVGITGIGKTALAERLTIELHNQNYFDLQKLRRKNFDHKLSLSDFPSIAIKWLEESGQNVSPEERKQPQKLLHRLILYFSNNAQLVLIDSLEFLLLGNEDTGWSDFIDELWCDFFINLLSVETCQSRFIITSQEVSNQFVEAASRYPNFWHCQRIDGLTNQEQIDLFNRSGLGESLKHSEIQLLLRIGQAYKGHPLVLRTIAGEIINDFASHVNAYWQQYGHEIEEVEKALAEVNQSMVISSQDQWKLDRYSVALRTKVKSRLEKTFNRLSEQVYYAYILLCSASVYRCPVQKSWWLRHLESRKCNQDQQQSAFQALEDRHLIEISLEQQQGIILIGMHNLVRSVALRHYQNLLTKGT